MNWVLFWLVLHVLAAIVAFGPTFAFPVIGAMAQKYPQHVPFALRLQETIAQRMVLPVAATMLVSGTGLLFAVGIDLIRTPYLLVAIGLYLIGMSNGLFVLLPTGAKLLHMVEGPTGAQALATAGPGAAAAMPPPEFMRLIRREQVFGALNSVIVIAIVALMIIKPGGIVPGPLFG